MGFSLLLQRWSHNKNQNEYKNNKEHHFGQYCVEFTLTEAGLCVKINTPIPFRMYTLDVSPDVISELCHQSSVACNDGGSCDTAHSCVRPVSGRSWTSWASRTWGPPRASCKDRFLHLAVFSACYCYLYLFIFCCWGENTCSDVMLSTWWKHFIPQGPPGLQGLPGEPGEFGQRVRIRLNISSLHCFITLILCRDSVLCTTVTRDAQQSA